MDRITALQNLLEDSPDDPFLKHALALEFIKRGRDNEAEPLFRSLLKANPAYLGSYYHLGRLLERTGNIPEAMEVYRAGIALAAAQSDAHARNELQMALSELTDDDEM